MGSTGSIGRQTLDIVRRRSDRFKVTSLVANNNWEELAAQAREFDVESVVIGNSDYYAPLKAALADSNIEVHAATLR